MKVKCEYTEETVANIHKGHPFTLGVGRGFIN